VLLLPRAVRVYVATEPVNLRRSFEGLSNEVRLVLRHDPLCGHVFVFLNRRKTMVKLLVWTRGGFTIVHKRLERGRFVFPGQVTSGACSVEIDVHELGMLLEGITAKTTAKTRKGERSDKEEWVEGERGKERGEEVAESVEGGKGAARFP
jgi:transposase